MTSVAHYIPLKKLLKHSPALFFSISQISFYIKLLPSTCNYLCQQRRCWTLTTPSGSLLRANTWHMFSSMTLKLTGTSSPGMEMQLMPTPPYERLLIPNQDIPIPQLPFMWSILRLKLKLNCQNLLTSWECKCLMEIQYNIKSVWWPNVSNCMEFQIKWSGFEWLLAWSTVLCYWARHSFHSTPPHHGVYIHVGAGTGKMSRVAMVQVASQHSWQVVSTIHWFYYCSK